MRALIVADIHSNLEALQSVVHEAEERGGFDAVWYLGDIVGYGPDPGACIDLLRSYPLAAIAGNHDLAAVGALGVETFNPYAAAAARWTGNELTEEHRAYVHGLPLSLECGAFTLVHGSPLDPVWEYFLPQTMPPSALQSSFRRFTTPYCLVGHSHIPLVCRESDLSFRLFPDGEMLGLTAERLVLNPGSVGQPRDGDPRPSYALYDSDAETIGRFRTTYAVEVTQEKMRRRGLPEYLAARLSHGR